MLNKPEGCRVCLLIDIPNDRGACLSASGCSGRENKLNPGWKDFDVNKVLRNENGKESDELLNYNLVPQLAEITGC